MLAVRGGNILVGKQGIVVYPVRGRGLCRGFQRVQLRPVRTRDLLDRARTARCQPVQWLRKRLVLDWQRPDTRRRMPALSSGQHDQAGGGHRMCGLRSKRVSQRLAWGVCGLSRQH